MDVIRVDAAGRRLLAADVRVRLVVGAGGAAAVDRGAQRERARAVPVRQATQIAKSGSAFSSNV